MKAIKRFDVTLYPVLSVHCANHRCRHSSKINETDKRQRGQEEESKKIMPSFITHHFRHTAHCNFSRWFLSPRTAFGHGKRREIAANENKTWNSILVGVISCEVYSAHCSRHWSVNRDGVDYSSMGFLELPFNVLRRTSARQHPAAVAADTWWTHFQFLSHENVGAWETTNAVEWED